jgi:hypothetical protein
VSPVGWHCQQCGHATNGEYFCSWRCERDYGEGVQYFDNWIERNAEREQPHQGQPASANRGGIVVFGFYLICTYWLVRLVLG